MANKRTDLENDIDRSLDDFDLNFDDFGDSKESRKQQKSRRPITKIVTNVGRGSLSHLGSSQFVRGALRDMLPNGYNTAIDTGYQIKDTASQVYNEIQQEWRKTEPALRRTVGRMLPENNKILPKGVYDALKRYSAGGNQFSGSTNTDESSIREALSELGAIQLSEQARENAENHARQDIRDQLASRQFKANYSVLASIDARMAKANAFNDQIVAKYMRRSLELQYRQFFMARDTQKLLANELGQTRQLLSAIMHNTALPDAVKATSREKIEQTLRNRLGNVGVQASAAFMRNFFPQIKQRAAGSVRNIFAGMQGALGGVDMFHDSAEMMREMGGDVTAESAQMLGSGLMAIITSAMAGGVKGQFRRSGFTAQRGAQIGRFALNLPHLLERWASTPEDTTTISGRFKQWLKDIVPRKHTDRRLGSSAVIEAGEAGILTRRFQRSVEEVMPGYLSRILHELTQIRQKRNIDDSQRLVYNSEQNRFTSQAEHYADMDTRMFNSRQAQFGRQQVQDFADRVLGGARVSPAAYAALQTQITEDILSGKEFSLARYTRPSAGMKHLAPHRQELQRALRGRAKKQGGGSDKVTKAELDASYNTLFSTVPNPKNIASAYHDLGEMDYLRSRGLSTRLDDTFLVDQDALVRGVVGNAGVQPEQSRYSREVPEYVGAGATANALERMRDPRADLFKPGVPGHVVISAAKVGAGAYTSARTGQRIYLMRELLDGVLEDGRVIVTADQAAKLVTTSGEPLPAYLDRLRKDRKQSKLGGVVDKYVRNAGRRFDDFMAERGEASLRRGWRWARGRAGRVGEEISSSGASMGEWASRMDERAANAFTNLTTPGTETNDKLRHAAGAVSEAGRKVADKAKSLWRQAMDVKRYAVNLYLEGQLKPVIESHLLAAGEYISAKTNKPITDVREIVDGVKDKMGRWVLTPEQAVSDLRTQTGALYTQMVTEAQKAAEHLSKTQAGQTASQAASAARQTAQASTTAVRSHFAGAVQAAQAAAEQHAATGAVGVVNMDPLIRVVEAFREGNFERLESIVDILTNGALGKPSSTPPPLPGGKSGWADKWAKTRFGLFGRVGGRAAGAGASIVSTLGKGYGAYLRGVFGAGGWAAGQAGKGIKGLWNWAWEKPMHLGDEAEDVHVRGEPKPRLTKGDMLAGLYFSGEGHERKVVKAPKDIKGPVYDAEGNTIISAEDFKKGLTDNQGKSLPVRAVRGLFDLGVSIGSGLGGFYGAVFRAYGAIGQLGSRAIVNAVKGRRQIVDVYTRDDLAKPKLLATGMRADHYVSVKTGKFVRAVEDIDGPVRTVTDNMNFALSQEDFDKGLCDYKGEPFKFKESAFKGLIRNALNTGAGLASGYLGIMGHIGRAVGAVASSPFRLISKMFGGGWAMPGFTLIGKDGIKSADEKTHTLLQSVLKLLDARMPHSENYRPGSWQEELKEHEKEAEKRAKAGQPTNARSKNDQSWFAKLRDEWNQRKRDNDTGGSGSDIIDDLMDGTGRRRPPLPKKAGRIAKWLEKLKGSRVGKLGGKALEKLGGSRLGRLAGRVAGSRGGQIAGKFLGRTVGGLGRIAGGAGRVALNGGKLLLGLGEGGELAAMGEGALGIMGGAGSVIGGAASAVGSGLMAAGSAIGSILSAPVLLGAAAVAAVGAAAYYGYKYYSLKKSAPLRKLRMAQYGVDMNKDVWPVDNIQKLEGMLQKHVVIQGNHATIDPTGLDNTELLKIFGLVGSKWNPLNWFHSTTPKEAAADQAFYRWLANRFKPVFLAWESAVHQISPKTDMADADDALSKEQKLSLINQVMAIPAAVYGVADSPFGDTPISTDPKIVDAALKEAKAAIGDTKSQKGGATGAAAKAGKGAATIAAAAAANKPGASSKQTQGAAKAAMTNTAGKGVGAIAVLKAGSSSNFINQFMDSKVSALKAVRYKTYGLTDMVPERVKAVFLLENAVFDKVVYDAHGNAKFDEDVAFYFNEYSGYFGVSQTDDKAKLRWFSWFAKRFLPTLLQFATAVKQSNKNTKPQDAEDQLSPEHLLEVANQTQAATFTANLSSSSVWTFTDSPFDEKPLNTDSSITKPNIQALKDAVKQQTMREEQARKNGTLPDVQEAQDKPTTALGRFWAGVKNVFTGGPKPGTVTLPSGVDKGSAAANRFASTGTIAQPIGKPIQQPGNGTGGDINKLPNVQGSGKEAIMPLLDAAGKMAGVDPGVLSTFAGIESSYNPSAHASTSSAAGLFQFIGSTWQSMLAKYATKYGIDPRTPATDPRAAALMGAEYIKENQRQLSQALGRQPTDAELYLAHFLGPGGAVSMLKANPNALGVSVNPKAASANASIFYKGGQAQTVAGVLKEIDNRVSRFRPSGADLASANKAAANAAKPSASSSGGDLPTIDVGSGKPTIQAPDAPKLAGLTPYKPNVGGSAMPVAEVVPQGPSMPRMTADQRKAAVANAQSMATSNDQQMHNATVQDLLSKQVQLTEQMTKQLDELLTHTQNLPQIAQNLPGSSSNGSPGMDESAPNAARVTKSTPTRREASPISMAAARFG